MHLVGRFYRTIVEALPLPVFLVDDQLHVYRLNAAADRLSWLDPAVILRQHGDEVLRCLSHADSSEGCGRSAPCADCVVRNSALECIVQRRPNRRSLRFEAGVQGAKREMKVSVTIAPIPSEEGNVVLMIVEDLSEVRQLIDLIPICMHCKKIRDDHAEWQQVETYFNRCIGVNFSHGICPECLREFYKDTA